MLAYTTKNLTSNANLQHRYFKHLLGELSQLNHIFRQGNMNMQITRILDIAFQNVNEQKAIGSPSWTTSRLTIASRASKKSSRIPATEQRTQ